jgi:Ca-activated chloride channel family protein
MKTSIIQSKTRKNIVKKSLIPVIYFLSLILCYSQEEDKTLSPYFMVLSDNPEVDQLPLKSTTADVNIVGVIADVTINQVYKNEGKNALEAIYTFPASSNAAVYAMEMTVGDRKIKAKIEEKEKARNDYEQAKSEGKRASLLEQDRPNVFQMNVANILPGDEITVSLKYTELLIPENAKYQFVYPTVVSPRYSGGGSSSGNSDNFVNTPYLKSGNATPYNFSINVNLEAGMPIQNVQCETHKVQIKYPKTSNAVILLDPSENKGGNRDFVLNYQLAGDKIESGIMLYEHGDENFFLLMVQPPKKVMKEEIPPREYIFIVDVSGSMNGYPLEVSKKLLRNLVVNLKPTDMFNVIVFAGASGWLSESSLPANETNINKAVSFLDSQNGGGGTELLPALQKALSFPRQSESLSRSFVIVTDGYVNVEKEAFDLIRKNCDNANVFAFGIGSGVNRYIIEGMANAGMSEPLIVLDQTKADAEAEKFRQYINSPVLTQVKKDFSGFDVYDVEPVSIPDVLAERPVIIYGKYKGSAKGTITLKGKTGNGNYKKSFNVSETAPNEKNAAIRYLWARKRIQQLDDYNSVAYSDETKEQVTNLGLKYNLMTAYTSFIAIEEKVVNEGDITSVKQALPLPENVSDYAVGFEMEADEEDFTFSFYKAIEVSENLTINLKTKALTEIEKTFATAFGQIISMYSAIESISITVDANGTVTDVKVTGKNLTDDQVRAITEAARQLTFKSLRVNQEWKYEVKF